MEYERSEYIQTFSVWRINYLLACFCVGFLDLVVPGPQGRWLRDRADDERMVVIIFAARCYASAAYVVMRCLSVCVCHVREFCQNE